MTKTDGKPLHAPTLHHLEQLMTGLLEGVILMDPTGIILSANPAALKMHGVTALAELGETADDYATRFRLRHRDGRKLPRREYPLIRLLAGESFPDLIVEVSPLDADEPRWVHQVRDIVMDEDGGDPDCLGMVINDVSERFDAEDRFEAMFHANPAPALIIRVADQRYVLVNQGFLDLSGYEREQIIGKTLFDLDFLAEVDRKPFVKERVADGKTVPQLEAELPLAGGDKTLVILAGQPIELANEDCLLFTFADLEPRRRAQQALQATKGDENRIVQVNAAFKTLTGYADDAVVGRVADDLQLWNDASQRVGLETEIRERSGFRDHEVRLLDKTGGGLDCLVSAERISVDGTPCVLWLYQDISARRRGELELVEAIDAVMKDANWLSRSIMDKLATLRNPRTSAGASPPTTELSKREREVLELICQDLDDAAIATRLDLSRNTVRNHVARLYAKIGVNRRSAAVVWAHERGVGA
jgi:PAS domain S-box-containing protein